MEAKTGIVDAQGACDLRGGVGGQRHQHGLFAGGPGGRLGLRPGPATGPTLLALLGFGVWVLAAVAFFSRGLDRTLRLRRGPALLAGGAFVIGLLLFVVGLRLA